MTHATKANPQAWTMAHPIETNARRTWTVASSHGFGSFDLCWNVVGPECPTRGCQCVTAASSPAQTLERWLPDRSSLHVRVQVAALVWRSNQCFRVGDSEAEVREMTPSRLSKAPKGMCELMSVTPGPRTSGCCVWGGDSPSSKIWFRSFN